jgi:RNA polymerase sigma factor (sigma-70 family)
LPHETDCGGISDSTTWIWNRRAASLLERVVQTRERDALLRLCLDKLHPDYREALYLTYFEDFSQAEAAAVMGKNEKQIKNLVFRGKQALRALLESEGITDAHNF